MNFDFCDSFLSKYLLNVSFMIFFWICVVVFYKPDFNIFGYINKILWSLYFCRDYSLDNSISL